MNDLQRIVAIRGGALGDFLLGLPALQALREAFPEATLELIAPSPVLPLAGHLIDLATPIDRTDVAELFAGGERLSFEGGVRWRDADLAVVWLADTDGSVRTAFRRLGARRILHAAPFPAEPGHHATDHLLDSLLRIGVPVGEELRRRGATIRPGEAAREKAMHLLDRIRGDRGVVAIHPGSGGRWKNWPPRFFAQVADYLRQRGLAVALIRGPADEEPIGDVLAALEKDRPTVVEGLSLEELAAFLGLCSCHLGNDSGVAHLAAAAGAPVVALFGPTDPSVWGPRGRAVTVLRGRHGCEPCGRERALKCANRLCLESLRVDRVAEVVTESCVFR